MLQFTISNGNLSSEIIKSSNCNASDFPEKVKNELIVYGRENMICVNMSDIELSGNQLGKEAKSFLVDLYYREGDTSCTSRDDILFELFMFASMYFHAFA